MKILKLLNKVSLSILISFFFLQNSYSTEPIDIWKIENQPNKEDNIDNNEIIENENVLTESIFQITQQKNNKIQAKHSNENTIDQFTYYVTDGGWDSDIALVTLIVNETYDPPITEDYTFYGHEDESLEINGEINFNNSQPIVYFAENSAIELGESGIIEMYLQNDMDISGFQFYLSGDYQITEDYLPAGWEPYYNDKTILCQTKILLKTILYFLPTSAI